MLEGVEQQRETHRAGDSDRVESRRVCCKADLLQALFLGNGDASFLDAFVQNLYRDR